MIQPPNINDLMTPEEFAAIRDLHDRRLEEVHEQLRMTSVHDAAMALNLSEDEIRLYLASIRTAPAESARPKKSKAGLLVAAVMMIGLLACVAVGLLVRRALVSEPAMAKTSNATAPSVSFEPSFPVPMAGSPVPESTAAAPMAEVHAGEPAIADSTTSPQPSDDPGTSMPPQQAPTVSGSAADDGSGYPDAQYEKYSNTPAEPLPTSPDGQ